MTCKTSFVTDIRKTSKAITLIRSAPMVWPLLLRRSLTGDRGGSSSPLASCPPPPLGQAPPHLPSPVPSPDNARRAENDAFALKKP